MGSGTPALGLIDRARLARIGMRPGEEELYGLGGARQLTDAVDFLGCRLYRSRVRPALNSRSAYAITENKWVFYRLLAGFGIPVPTTFGLFDPVFGTTWDGAPLRTVDDALALLQRERPAGLVVKPAGGQQGYDVTVVGEIDYASGRGVARTGEEIRLEELLTSVHATSTRGFPGYVLQAEAAQHPEIARLSPTVTNTLRVVTLVSDEAVHVLSVVMRLGRAGNMTDNWEQGGLGVPVDPQTGVMGKAVLKPKHGGERVAAHPDTGVCLVGERLPFVAESVELSRRAALLLPGVRSVGWDVLITEDGPVLLEANSDWDLQLSQVHSDGFLVDGVLRDEIRSAGVPLPAALPSRASTIPHVVAVRRSASGGACRGEQRGAPVAAEANRQALTTQRSLDVGRCPRMKCAGDSVGGPN